jgi:Helix-loop-helix DNA-binding domain
MEKRRRRRESHNLVERRRRDNINDRIQELGLLLPDVTQDGANKPNKGQILRKSVEQIKLLQNEVNMYQSKVQELESLLERYKLTQHS